MGIDLSTNVYLFQPTVKKSVVKSNVATASVRSPPSTASSIATKSSSKNLSVDSVDNMSVRKAFLSPVGLVIQ